MKTIDPHLKSVLAQFSQSYLAKRQAALAGVDFEAARDELARVKDRTLDRLQEYLDLFESQVRHRGGKVYRARDSAEANRIVFQIMKECRADYLVKGKSMVSEETGLNPFLEARGIKVRETDLGEWIIQLCRQKPSHMVMPAIHLTREEVASVFGRYLKKDVPPDLRVLVDLARHELRRDIRVAGAGLIGANALIAENGSVMLITNEGNGRLVSLLPPVRIILTSVEKVLPTIEDAFLILKLLPPNATGQVMTSYVSFLTSSSSKPLHIVLLDNHRTEVLANPVFRKILRCVKCSACLNVCPVYQILGGKEYGHVYMGGIGTLLTAWVHGLRESRKLADLCLGCHRCESFCAACIPIADLIIALRENLHQQLGKPLWKSLLFDHAMATPNRWRALFTAVRAARPFVAGREGFVRTLPGPLKKYDERRVLPAPARATLSGRTMKDRAHVTIPGSKPGVVLFAGCLIEYFYPEIGEAALRVLEKLGHKAHLAKPGCCGFPALNAGFSEAARNTLAGLFDDFQGGERILTLCPTCTTMLKKHGPEILASEEARCVAERVMPISQFVLACGDRELKKHFPHGPASLTVTYHDSCHHKHVLGAARDSRSALEIALGQKIREMDSSDACCGFGGLFSVSHPELSSSLLQDKLDSIGRSGANLVALDCPGCLLQIKGGSQASKLKIEVKHTIEIIEARLAGKF